MRHPIPVQTPDVSPDIRCQSRHPIPVQTSDTSPDTRCQSRHPIPVQTSDPQSRHPMSVQTPDVSPDIRPQSRHQMSVQTSVVIPDTRCQSRHPLSVQTAGFQAPCREAAGRPKSGCFQKCPRSLRGAPGASPESPGASGCLLYTSPSPRDRTRSRMPSSA